MRKAGGSLGDARRPASEGIPFVTAIRGGVKMRARVLMVCLGLGVVAPTTEAAPAASRCDALVGSWEYVSPSDPGRVIISKQGDGTYLAVWIIARASQNAADAGAWQATCEGQRLRWHVLFSTDAAAVGTEQVQEWEASGDHVRYWLLTPDGKRGPQGAAHLLK